MIGQTISHYSIVEKLGGGGMGVVYKAEDTRLHRFVALKFLPDKSPVIRRPLSAFDAKHGPPRPLTIPTFAPSTTSAKTDRNYIVMEYLEGSTLKHRIEGKPISWRQIGGSCGSRLPTRWMWRTRQGIIHRDIKPANIFITKRGQAKMLDFGLAKVIAAPAPQHSGATMATAAVDPANLTSPGSTVGTVAYMSPEQARGEELDVAHGSVFFRRGVV